MWKSIMIKIAVFVSLMSAATVQASGINIAIRKNSTWNDQYTAAYSVLSGTSGKATVVNLNGSEPETTIYRKTEFLLWNSTLNLDRLESHIGVLGLFNIRIKADPGVSVTEVQTVASSIERCLLSIKLGLKRTIEVHGSGSQSSNLITCYN
jgi:hypothetical protein